MIRNICCKNIIADRSDEVKYNPITRCFFIKNRIGFGEGFTKIKYCPSCGTKFPECLEEKLSKILQSEYGLESWKDYEKAPIEFHSDKWWKKRKL